MADRNQAGLLWTVTEILSGLRYEKEIIQLVMRKVMNMVDLEESSTYRAMVAKTLRSSIVRLGRLKFGEPQEDVTMQLASISELERLRRILDNTIVADSWQQILEESSNESLN